MKATTIAAPAPQARPRPTLQGLIGVAAVLLGTFTSILNARLTDIGLADLRGALGIGFDEGSWITTAYVVAEVAAIPAAVWLRGILSPARGVLLGSLLFTLLSLVIPLSRTLPALLTLQALRGLSAGILIPMAYAVVMRHMPQHLRLYGLSFYALVSALTPSLAVSIEAWILTHLSWEYLFWLNVVPGALTLFAGAYGLTRDPIKYMRFRRHDGFGLFVLSLGLAAAVAALDQGNRLDWSESGLIVGLTLAALLLLAAYGVHALLHPDPVVSPRLLWRRNVGLGLLLIFGMRIALMASAYLLPQYLARVQGYRALESGSTFLIAALPQLLLTPLVAWLCYRIDPRNLLAFGGTLLGASILSLADLTNLWAMEQVLPSLVMQSIAAPFIAVPIMVLLTEAITAREIPWIASLVHIVRTVSTAIGLAIVSTLVRVQEQIHSNLIGQHVQTGSLAVQDRLDALSQAIDNRAVGAADATARATALIARSVQREAFVMAYADAFVALGITMLLVTLAVLLFCRTRLPGKFL